MHPNSLDKVRVRAVGPSFSQTATSRVPGDRGELKKQRQRQATNPEENRQSEITKLGDDQERRAKWRKTKGRELLASTKKLVDEDSQESPTAKTCSSYEKKPARTKKYQKKQRQLLKQVPTRKPTRKGNRGKGATWTPPCSQVSQPTGRRTQIQQSETERNEVSDPLEHKVSITQDIPLSRERMGEGPTCPGLSSTKPGRLSFTSRPSRFPRG